MDKYMEQKWTLTSKKKSIVQQMCHSISRRKISHKEKLWILSLFIHWGGQK